VLILYVASAANKLKAMRFSSAFISTQAYHIKKRIVQQKHSFRRADGSTILFQGGQFISIARIEPRDTEGMTVKYVQILLVTLLFASILSIKT